MAQSVGIRDVAAAAGVSVATVSNVLNRPGRVSTTTAIRVQRAITTLGFVRNDAARQLRGGRSHAIGLIVLDIGNPFFADLARGAETAAELAGNSVLIGSSDQDAAREERYLDLFEEQRVLGVLVSPRGDVSGRLQRLRERGIPSVLLDHASDRQLSCSVSVDDVAGGALATGHLIEMGHKRICLVGGPANAQQFVDRVAGAKRAVAAAGVGVVLEIIAVDEPTVGAGMVVGESIVDRSTADRPNAIFASNDLVAMGLLQSFVLRGSIRVPDDIALIGYDDISYASTAVIPISSIRQPSASIGRMAVELLLQETEDLEQHAHRQVVFPPELVARASSMPRA